MKAFVRFLAVFMLVVPLGGAFCAVSTTAGSNLTAWNGSLGSANNNSWNAMLTSRDSAAANASAPKSDFGNCNALIMRCAQPKCAGCTTMDIAMPIVAGCVQSTPSCKQYGDDLVQYMAAQLVANASANNAAAEVAAAQAAAASAAQQSAAQMQQMQMQMQQMQAEMASQNAATVAQLQSALEEQKQLTAQAIADATIAAAAATPAPVQQTAESVADIVSDGLTASQTAAASNGVSAEILAREQITGQVYTAIENAEKGMRDLKNTMLTSFEYAGCDTKGNNCTGPKRVKVFKEKAMQFFDPYENVLDELYDALILAQSVGVDISDIYMMLNGTCNAWAQYLCMPGQTMHYTTLSCVDDISVPQTVYEPGCKVEGTCKVIGTAPRGGARCKVGQVVPMSDGGCQLVKMLTSNEEVQRNWLYPDEGTGGDVRVGCASEALDNSTLFRNRKKQATIDIETLQRIIEQDAPSYFGAVTLQGKTRQGKDPQTEIVKYCAINFDSLEELQKAAGLKQLTPLVCTTDDGLTSEVTKNGTLSLAQAADVADFGVDCKMNTGDKTPRCKCFRGGGKWVDGACRCEYLYTWNADQETCDVDRLSVMLEHETNLLIDELDKQFAADAEAFQKSLDERYEAMQACNSKGGYWDSKTDKCSK